MKSPFNHNYRKNEKGNISKSLYVLFDDASIIQTKASFMKLYHFSGEHFFSINVRVTFKRRNVNEKHAIMFGNRKVFGSRSNPLLVLKSFN